MDQKRSCLLYTSDIIAPDEGGYAKAVAPEKLNYYIRQYNADIQLAYSRDDAHSYNQGYRGHPIYDQVKNDILDGDIFLKNCLEAKCNYIITDSDWNLSDDKLREYGYDYSCLLYTSIYRIPFTPVYVEFGCTLTDEMLKCYEGQGYTALLVNLHETSTGQLYDGRMLGKFCRDNGPVSYTHLFLTEIKRRLRISNWLFIKPLMTEPV